MYICLYVFMYEKKREAFYLSLFLFNQYSNQSISSFGISFGLSFGFLTNRHVSPVVDNRNSNNIMIIPPHFQLKGF